MQKILNIYFNALISGDLDLASLCIINAREDFGLSKEQMEHEIFMQIIELKRQELEMPHDFECDCKACIEAARVRSYNFSQPPKGR